MCALQLYNACRAPLYVVHFIEATASFHDLSYVQAHQCLVALADVDTDSQNSGVLVLDHDTENADDEDNADPDAPFPPPQMRTTVPTAETLSRTPPAADTVEPWWKLYTRRVPLKRKERSSGIAGALEAMIDFAI